MSTSSLFPFLSKSNASTLAVEPKQRTASHVTLAERLQGWLGALERVTVIIIALVAIALHVRFVTHVGGLWRDEANSVQLSTLPTITEVWHNLDFDSFPILFFVLLRSWTGVFGADSDAALRLLGLIIGLSTLGVLFVNARTSRGHLPVLSIALIGLNPMLIRYGDSTRAYGLGILLLLLTLWSFWRLVESPSFPGYTKILTAGLLAVLSVQCLYYNSVLLLAICAGATAVAMRIKAWRTVGIILAIGFFGALSLLPYLPMIRRMHAWTFLVSYPVDLAWLWKRSCEVTGSPDPICIWLWTGLFVAGLGVAAGAGVSTIWSRSKTRRKSERELPPVVLFAAVSLFVAVPAYAGFLWILNYYTQPWYYITITAFAACALDVVFGAWPANAKFLQLPLLLRAVRVVAAFTLLCIAGLPAWAEMPIRHTNVDLLAAQLRSQTVKGDVILISHWQYAISLYRYYGGPAEIITLPPIDDHRFHRYDLALRQMMTADPLQPVFVRLDNVLRSGHRVFLAGRFNFPKPDFVMPSVAPGYLDASGQWHGAAFEAVWSLQAGHFLRSHATRLVQIKVAVPDPGLVQGFENLELGMAEGCR